MERVFLNGAPVVGFGEPRPAVAPAKAPSPWTVAIATSVLGAATGWAIEEVAKRVRRPR